MVSRCTAAPPTAVDFQVHGYDDPLQRDSWYCRLAGTMPHGGKASRYNAVPGTVD